MARRPMLRFGWLTCLTCCCLVQPGVALPPEERATAAGCGDEAVDAGEECDGSSDLACPGRCRPPGDSGGECTCAPLPPLGDVAVLFPDDPSKVAKNRFISVVMPAEAAGQEVAIRVEFVSIAAPPDGPEPPVGRLFRYVTGFAGGAEFICDDSGSTEAYNCGQLGCTPVYRDWGDITGEMLHITGDSVHPGSQYAASLIPASCGGAPAADACPGSPELLLDTASRGDTADTAGDPLVLDGVANVIDVSYSIDKIKTLPGAFSEPRMWTKDSGFDPVSSNINILDCVPIIDKMKNVPYSPHSFFISSCP